MTALSVRENPPLRLSVNVTPPSGQSFRWGRDQPRAADVPSSIGFSTTAPGGFDTMTCTLPRRAKLAYPDLELLSNLTVHGAGGQIAWEGRIQSVPRDSGQQMAVSPQAVGYQAHLEDQKNARVVYVDRDLNNWRGISRARQITQMTGNVNPNDGSVTFDNTGQLPAIALNLQGPWVATSGAICESYYDAGAGNLIASIYWDRTSNSDVAGQPDGNFAFYVGAANTDDTLSGLQLTADQHTGVASAETGTFTPTTGLRFGLLSWSYGFATASAGLYSSYVRRLTVWGNHGLTKRGTAPSDGLYASDVIAHALSQFAPLLSYSTGANGTIAAAPFVIPQLVFRDPTTAAAIITEANRFSLNDWFVWEGSRANNPTFYYHARGARGKAWRARVGPSGLSETGQSDVRLYNGVVVSYQDVDGSTRTVGPTGAQADSTSSSLVDADSLNPANKLGIRRWQLLDMNGVSTLAGATEVGRRFLVESKALDTSGRADIAGYVEDDRGTRYPSWRIRSGDTITFLDSADPSPRRVVKTAYSDDSKVNSIDLDAPPEGLDSLLERLGVVLVQFGL